MAADAWTLRYLLDLDGEEILYEGGYVARFRIVRVPPTRERPYGIAYSLTLHDRTGNRILGFDNAHAVESRGGRRRRAEHDHWHRDERDPGRPYRFTDAETLIADFFDAVAATLRERRER